MYVPKKVKTKRHRKARTNQQIKIKQKKYECSQLLQQIVTILVSGGGRSLKLWSVKINFSEKAGGEKRWRPQSLYLTNSPMFEQIKPLHLGLDIWLHCSNSQSHQIFSPSPSDPYRSVTFSRRPLSFPNNLSEVSSALLVVTTWACSGNWSWTPDGPHSYGRWPKAIRL